MTALNAAICLEDDEYEFLDDHNGFSYDDAMSTHIVVSRDRAREEIDVHNADFAEFIRDVGDFQHYTSKEVLSWLGY